MPNDFLMDAGTEDWSIADGAINLCSTTEQLTRQRLSITLKAFLGEWFANRNFGVPYFETVYGKNTKVSTDISIRGIITGVEGVTSLLSYISTHDPKTRTISIQFKALVDSGEIIEEDITL